ncbi:MAG: hypothetical protein AAFR49_05120 [Pseudomonadota bacterium]
MNVIRRSILVGVAALGLAGCAGPAPTGSVLEETSRANLKIVGTDVSVDKIGLSTKGRPVPADRVDQLVTAFAQQGLVGQGAGAREVNAVIDLESVNVITAGQSILIGGESVMAGKLSLVDARTGDELMPPTDVRAGGGGWVLGGFVAVAARDEAETEVSQMAQRFVERSKTLVFGAEE